MTYNDNDDEAQVIAWVSSDFMDWTAGNISRGRKFLNVSDSELADAWTEAVKASCRDLRNHELLDIRGYYTAELHLRGIEPPHERVEEEVAKSLATIEEYLSSLTLEQRKEIGESVKADFEAFLRSCEGGKS